MVPVPNLLPRAATEENPTWRPYVLPPGNQWKRLRVSSSEIMPIQHATGIMFDDLTHSHAKRQFPDPGIFNPAAHSI